jgi:predicted TIM-barrel fold metal-dependent hydrolase
MPEVRDGLENVYFDTAASPFLYGPQVFETVAGLIGSEKILLGSDFPLLRPGRLLKQIGESALPTVEAEAITGSNAATLLGLD